MEQRIQKKAEELFFTYGLKSVSMDDIAKETGVSKKTIYQFFDDKNAIVSAIISKLIEEQQQELGNSLSKSENAIHEVVLISESLKALIIKIKPIILYDLNKYFPECWKVMKAFKEEDLKTALANNLRKGLGQGLYRENLDFDTICQFSLVQFSSFFEPDNYPNTAFQINKVVEKVTELFLFGIASDKGNLLVKKYIDNK